MDTKLPKIDFSVSDNASTSVASGSSIISKSLGFLFVVLLGIGSGYLIHLYTGKPSATKAQTSKISAQVGAGGLKVGDIIGSADESTFKDKVTGVLEQGGMNGEGSHHLLRPGGASQTVYLTSTYVDLDEFVGDKVTVWGETFKAQRVGWLMDAGRIKVEELNAAAPTD